MWNEPLNSRRTRRGLSYVFRYMRVRYRIR